MNVLFLSQIVPYPPHGGVLQRGYNILREIGKYNHVHLLAFVHPEYLGTPEKLEEAKNHLGRFCKTVEFFTLWPKQSNYHKLAAFAAGLFYPYPFSALAHKSRMLGIRIESILREYAMDIVHIDTIGLARYFTLCHGIPTVLTHHNIESTLMERRAEVESNMLARFYVSLQAKRLRAYEASQSPRFDCNLMVSSNDAHELLQMAPTAKTAVIPNGVDTEYFVPRLDAQENAVIYTGGMNMFANKDAVLHFINDIWPTVRSQVQDAIFYVVGQDPPQELLEISGQYPSIRVLGFVDDIRPYVARAAVYVVPLRVGGGTRMKVLDSLAQGKAILSTSVGCEGIEVENELNIYIEDRNDRFAERVIELFRNPERRAQLGMEARKLAVEKYGWESIGRSLQSTYESVVLKKRK